jgi:surface protein
MAKYIFDSNVYEDFLPQLNNGYLDVNYEVIDDVKADGRVVRTLKYLNNNRPVLIAFGRSGNDYPKQSSLLKAVYVDVKSNITTMHDMFARCANINYINTRNWDTSNVTDMYCLFTNCRSLPSIEVSHFDVRKVEDMWSLFGYCHSLKTIDVSTWETSSVTCLHNMFVECRLLEHIDLSNFNTSQVTNVANMFSSCTALQSVNIDNWDLSNITNSSNMFIRSMNLESISVNNCTIATMHKVIANLSDRNKTTAGKLYSLVNNIDYSLLSKTTLDNNNWKLVIRGGNIKAVHIPNELFQSLGLGNVMVKHVHVGERFL